MIRGLKNGHEIKKGEGKKSRLTITMISMLNALDVLSSAEKPSRSGYEEDELFLSDEDDSECHLDNAHAESAFLTLQVGIYL